VLMSEIRSLDCTAFAPSCCRAANPVDYTCSAWVLCNRLPEHHYRYHEDFQSEFSIMDKSEVLHQLLIPGALEQNVSRNIFPIVDRKNALLLERL
jgi:hypothetical protein